MARWAITGALLVTLMTTSAFARAECSQAQTWGWVVGATGGAGVVVGAVLGGLAIEQHDIHQEHCSARTASCDQQGIDAREAGEVLGAASTVTLVLSGAMVVAGIVLIVGGGETEQVALRVAPTGAELALSW